MSSRHCLEEIAATAKMSVDIVTFDDLVNVPVLTRDAASIFGWEPTSETFNARILFYYLI